VVKYLKNPVFLSFILCILIFYSGLFKIDVEKKFNSFYDESLITVVNGKLESSPVKNAAKNYYTSYIRLQSLEYKNKLKAQAEGSIKVIIPAKLVEAYYPGKLYSDSGTDKNALFESGGNYTLKGYFKNKCFYVKSFEEVWWDTDLWGRTEYFRALCRLQFKRLMYTWGKAGGLLLALLSGAKEYTEESLIESFRNTGLSHILALSGMHLSLFSGIAMFIGKKTKRKKLSFIIRIFALFFFVWFAGLSPSLCRAFLCSMLTLIAAASNTENPDLLLILALSYLIQINIFPWDLYNTGLILSYAALAGILIFSAPIKKFYSKKLPAYFSSSLSASTGAQVLTMPVSLKTFGFISPIGILATTFVSPLIIFFIYIGLAFIILCLICPYLSSYSAIIMNFLYTVIKYLVLIFSKVPGIRIGE
jgi:competence protein ComEC